MITYFPAQPKECVFFFPQKNMNKFVLDNFFLLLRRVREIRKGFVSKIDKKKSTKSGPVALIRICKMNRPNEKRNTDA